MALKLEGDHKQASHRVEKRQINYRVIEYRLVLFIFVFSSTVTFIDILFYIR